MRHWLIPATLLLAGLARADEGQIALTAGASGSWGSCTTSTVTAPLTGTCTIVEPGAYFLSKRVIHSSGVAILISADSVSIDLNGQVVEVQGTSSSDVAIQSTGSGTRLYNGTIKGGGFGIGYQPTMSDGSIRLDDITITGAGEAGISVQDSSGSARVEIRRLTVVDSDDGIVLEGVGSAILDEVVSSGNDGEGLYAGTANNLLVRDSMFSANGVYGARLLGANTALFRRCSFSDDGSTGLRLDELVDEVRSVVVEESVLSSNGGHGLQVRDASQVAVVASVLSLNAGEGVRVEDNSLGSDTPADLYLRWLQLSMNGGWGLYLDSSVANAVYGNLRWHGNSSGTVSDSGTDSLDLSTVSTEYSHGP